MMNYQVTFSQSWETTKEGDFVGQLMKEELRKIAIDLFEEAIAPFRQEVVDANGTIKIIIGKNGAFNYSVSGFPVRLSDRILSSIE